MANYTIVTNKIGTKATLRIIGNTNFSVNTLSVGSQEVVGAATLTSIYVTSNDATSSSYYRANTSNAQNRILTLLPNDHGFFDFAGNGISPDNDNKTANIIFNITGANNTVIIAEFHKQSSYQSEY